MSNFVQYRCGIRTRKLNTANNKTLDGKDSYPFPSTNYYIYLLKMYLNPLNPELNPICSLLTLLAHHFLHVSRIRVKSLTLRLLMSYICIYGAPILDVSRSYTTTHHSR